MHAVPESIRTFLQEHQVISLALCQDNRPWAASAFFAYDENAQRLLFLSATDTRHGAMLVRDPHVAGTIAGQFTDITQIHGLQYEGLCVQLQGEEAQQALEIYYQRYPQARGMSAPVWEIQPTYLKLTDNRLGFGTKILWDRHDG